MPSTTSCRGSRRDRSVVSTVISKLLQRGQATGDLIDVSLGPAGFRKVTRTDHEYAQWPLQ